MANPNREIVRIVLDYLVEANFYAGILFHLAGDEHPLRAWHSGRLRRRWADRDLRRSFSLHGTGCTVGPKKHAISFDFSDEGKVTSIDPHKVYDYAVARPSRYDKLPSRKVFVDLVESHAEVVLPTR